MRMPADLKERLAEEAARQRRSLSNMVEVILDRALPQISELDAKTDQRVQRKERVPT